MDNLLDIVLDEEVNFVRFLSPYEIEVFYHDGSSAVIYKNNYTNNWVFYSSPNTIPGDVAARDCL